MFPKLPGAVDDEPNLRGYLSRRDAETLIVGSSELAGILRNVNAASVWVHDTGYDGDIKGCKTVFVLTDDELALCDKIRNDHPRVQVISVRYQMYPAMLAKLQPLTAVMQPIAEIQTKYAIFCCPRTGSTFLCSLLSQAGMGNPLEHLRPPGNPPVFNGAWS